MKSANVWLVSSVLMIHSAFDDGESVRDLGRKGNFVSREMLARDFARNGTGRRPDRRKKNLTRRRGERGGAEGERVKGRMCLGERGERGKYAGEPT